MPDTPSARPKAPVEPFLVPILAVAMVNGVFSPVVGLALVIVPLWYPFVLPFSPAFAVFMTSLVVSTATLMLAGIPAALYERFFGSGETDTVSLWIWLVGVLLLSFPAVQNLLSIGL